MALEFYICPICGNIVTKIKDSKVPVFCCGQPMKLLVANTTDAAQEKHVPLVAIENNEVRVKVGSVEHPQIPEHFIEFIALETNLGFSVQYLLPNSKPEATFALTSNEKVKNVFAYCNLHSLWKKSL